MTKRMWLSKNNGSAIIETWEGSRVEVYICAEGAMTAKTARKLAAYLCACADRCDAVGKNQKAEK